MDEYIPRASDLNEASELLQRWWSAGEWPQDVPDRALYSLLSTLGLCQLLVVVLLPRGRKLLWDIFETVAATVLALLLVACILGLPFGAVYIGYKGLFFVASSLLQAFPQLREMLESLARSIKLRTS